MSRDEIIAMAKEAGGYESPQYSENLVMDEHDLTRFAALVAARERERICAAIKAEDDYCVDHGDYMLDSDDCIKIVRGEWVRPDFFVAAARKKGANHD